jgi:hypothetical protein
MGQQAATTFDPGGLDFSETYYWRVDEVNGAPDFTVFKGDVWTFEVEPVSYVISADTISVTASSMSEPQVPDNTINGSGLNESGQHSVSLVDMWLSDTDDLEPWIQYAFNQLQKLDKVYVWNHNSQTEAMLGFGIKEVLVETSLDGENWSVATTVEISQATGFDSYTGTVISLEGVLAQYLRMSPQSNYNLLGLKQTGLSEVRFYSIPVMARMPIPADGDTSDGIDITLAWRSGREAVQHEVLFSGDLQAVLDGSAVVATVDDPALNMGTLKLNSQFYWKVNELNSNGTPSVYEGNLWSFTTPDHRMIDDMEDYRATEGLFIWEHWIDGYGDLYNGSVVGHFDKPETVIVSEGLQSLPLSYDYTPTTISEATLTLSGDKRDWTKGAPEFLSLQIAGDPLNDTADVYILLMDATGKSYTIVEPEGTNRPDFTPATTLALADLSGLALDNMDSITIGVRNPDADIPRTGLQGTIYIDNIRLVRP